MAAVSAMELSGRISECESNAPFARSERYFLSEASLYTITRMNTRTSFLTLYVHGIAACDSTIILSTVDLLCRLYIYFYVCIRYWRLERTDHRTLDQLLHSPEDEMRATW